MRRPLAIAVLFAAVLLALSTSQAGAGTTPVFVDDNFFNPPIQSLAEPGMVTWDWEEVENPHNVVARGNLFDSGKPGSRLLFELNLSAGTFPYLCEVHFFLNDMKGTIQVRPSWIAEPPGPERSFRVAWATPESTTGDEFDVRYRAPGERWKSWKSNTRALQARFGARGKPVRVQRGKLYRFQVRSESSSNPRTDKSGFSPVLTVRGGQTP